MPWTHQLWASGMGLVAIQLLAVPVHARRNEWSLLPVKLVLGGVAAFVAVARFGWL